MEKLNKAKKEFQPLASGLLAAQPPNNSYTLVDGPKLSLNGEKSKGI